MQSENVQVQEIVSLEDQREEVKKSKNNKFGFQYDNNRFGIQNNNNRFGIQNNNRFGIQYNSNNRFGFQYNNNNKTKKMNLAPDILKNM